MKPLAPRQPASCKPSRGLKVPLSVLTLVLGGLLLCTARPGFAQFPLLSAQALYNPFSGQQVNLIREPAEEVRSMDDGRLAWSSQQLRNHHSASQRILNHSWLLSHQQGYTPRINGKALGRILRQAFGPYWNKLQQRLFNGFPTELPSRASDREPSDFSFAQDNINYDVYVKNDKLTLAVRYGF